MHLFGRATLGLLSLGLLIHLGLGCSSSSDSSGAEPDAGGPQGDSPFCSTGGWCWETPLPQGNDLGGIWVGGPQDIWTIGTNGTIMHGDGEHWKSYSLDTYEILNRIWALDSKQIWAVGNAGTVFKWDGTSWNRLSMPVDEDLIGIWGTSASDYWVVGKGIYHWNGQAFESYSVRGSKGKESFVSIWGTSSNDIWAMGANWDPANPEGVLAHWDGTQWTAQFPYGQTSLTSAWGSSPTDVWVVGVGDTFLHWDGQAWLSVPQTAGKNCFSITGTASNDIWASCLEGRLIHWNGRAWEPENTGSLETLWSIEALGPDNVWVVGKGGLIEHKDGQQWKRLSSPTPNMSTYGFWVFSETDMWAAGGFPNNMAHWDGASWHIESLPTDTTLIDIWGLDPEHLWAVGQDGTVVHRANGQWSALPLYDQTHDGQPRPTSIWAASDADVWVVGEQGKTWHWDGAHWTEVQSGTTNWLYSVRGSSPTDVWAAGLSGTLLHWTGSHWSPTELPTPAQKDSLISLASPAPNDLWVCGYSGLWHWDGQGWTESPGFANLSCNNLWAAGPKDIWITDLLGTAHYNGTGWTVYPSGASISGFGAANGKVWALSASGGLLSHR